MLQILFFGFKRWPYFREVWMDKLNEKEKIIVVTTGGTIEKSYNEEDGTLQNRESIVKRVVFDNLRLPYTYVSYHSIIGKDSLEMTDSDRELLYMFLKNMLKNGDPIVVIHGTDTMSVSLKYCYDRLINEGLSVAIVFTGAMKPVEFLDSDAVQNVTEAVTAAKLLRPGLYISFHGRIFKAPNVRKNYQKGTFEAFEVLN